MNQNLLPKKILSAGSEQSATVATFSHVSCHADDGISTKSSISNHDLMSNPIAISFTYKSQFCDEILVNIFKNGLRYFGRENFLHYAYCNFIYLQGEYVLLSIVIVMYITKILLVRVLAVIPHKREGIGDVKCA